VRRELAAKDSVVSYPTLHRFARDDLGFGRRVVTLPTQRQGWRGAAGRKRLDGSRCPTATPRATAPALLDLTPVVSR